MKPYLIVWIEAPAVPSTVSYDEKNNLSKGTKIFATSSGLLLENHLLLFWTIYSKS